MQTLEFTANERTIIIAIDRTALNTVTLAQITAYLQEHIPRDPQRRQSASELRRLPPDERNAILMRQAAGDDDYEVLEDNADIIEE